MFHVGDVARKLRELKGWKKGPAFAKHAGVNKNTLSKFERLGRYKPDTLEKISHALGYTPQSLLALVPCQKKRDDDHDDEAFGGIRSPQAPHRPIANHGSVGEKLRRDVAEARDSLTRLLSALTEITKSSAVLSTEVPNTIAEDGRGNETALSAISLAGRTQPSGGGKADGTLSLSEQVKSSTGDPAQEIIDSDTENIVGELHDGAASESENAFTVKNQAKRRRQSRKNTGRVAGARPKGRKRGA